MKLLLTSLLSLSSICGPLAAGITTLNTNNVSHQVTPMRDHVKIKLDKDYELITENDALEFSTSFSWNWSAGGPEEMAFGSGGGLKSYVNWGGDIYQHSWDKIKVNSNGSFYDILSERHYSGFASQLTWIKYRIEKVDANRAKLVIYSESYSHASFSTAWGKLTIGHEIEMS